MDITDVTKGTTIQFSYSVEWYEEPNLIWKNRMSRYAESRFLPSSFEIHWLSIINSFVLVLLLTAFLTIILLRVLKNDFSRYMELDDDVIEEEEVRTHVKGVLLFGTIFLLLAFSNKIMPFSVWMEIDSWRCLSFPSSSGCVLCSRWGWESVAGHDLFPFVLGFDWTYLNYSPWINFSGSGRAILSYFVRCGVHICPSL